MIIRRLYILTLVFFVLFIHWAGISDAGSKKRKVILKMATNVPEGTSLSRFLNQDVYNGVLRVTDGEVTIDWYHGGIMGDNRDWIAKMEIDQLQGAGLDGSGVDLAFRDMGILQLPFLFKDFDEVAYIKKRIRGKVDNGFGGNGYKMLMIIDQSFDDIFSIKREVRTPDDFAKVKFVSYSGIVEREMFKALGSSPIPLNVPEVVSSIRSGICNGLACPSGWYVGSQLYTLGGYVTPSKMRYVLGSIVLSIKSWNRIPLKHHEPIVKVMRDLEPKVRQTLMDLNENSLKAMVKYGLNEVKLTSEELDVLKKRTRPVWDKLVGNVYPRELLDEILGYLEEYRSKKTALNQKESSPL
ncbi:MAG: TRAP transporter substrate-binding protein DctP [Thermodesulfobacteriota bacterium]|nr:TRAP transporter substrate-binding protein DctP [Thermodesulfobacteriota bacterium]